MRSLLCRPSNGFAATAPGTKWSRKSNNHTRLSSRGEVTRDLPPHGHLTSTQSGWDDVAMAVWFPHNLELSQQLSPSPLWKATKWLGKILHNFNWQDTKSTYSWCSTNSTGHPHAVHVGQSDLGFEWGWRISLILMERLPTDSLRVHVVGLHQPKVWSTETFFHNGIVNLLKIFLVYI